jgi:ketosteroid isomerase-like protein
MPAEGKSETTFLATTNQVSWLLRAKLLLCAKASMIIGGGTGRLAPGIPARRRDDRNFPANPASTSVAQGVQVSIPSSNLPSRNDAERLARENLAIVASGDLDSADVNVAPDFWDHQAGDTPEAVRQRGPAAFRSTVTWLHRAFTDISFDIHDAYVDGDRVALYVTFHARQHGAFIAPGPPNGPATEFPATGRSFHSRAVHMFRIRDGKVAEHDALRDDLAMARQLGWIPSGPA